MTVTLKTLDQVPGRARSEGPSLKFEVGEITARQIVRARVLEEVARHNDAAGRQEYVGFLLAPPAEQALNAVRRPRQPLDPERQVEVALAAVRAGRVLVLYNGEQVTDLDAPLLVTPVSEACFLRLVALVGG